MRIEHSDENTLGFIDEAAMSFMALTTDRLNAALIENGVSDAAVRQSICAHFLFEFAYHHDAGWLLCEDRKVFPKISLAERADPTPDENLGKVEVLHVPTEASSWHEYAHGVVSQYFEEHNEEVQDLRRGSYDIED